MLTVSEIIKSVDSDEKLFERVEDCLNGVKLHFVKLGYLLRILKERGYDNAFLHDRFGISKSTINRCIQINEQFSEDGYSFKIAEKYADFSKSQLVEMLPLSEDQREDVTPDMSIADIRDLKNQEDIVDDSIGEIEEPDVLPEFNISDKIPAIRAAFAKKLSEMPEIGRDINKMITYIENAKDEDIHFIVENVDLYFSLNGSYLSLDSDEVDIVGGYTYLYVYNFSSYPEVMEYSDYEHFRKISCYSVSDSLSQYLVNEFDDWDYIGSDLKNVAKLLADCVPLEFELDNKYLVRIEGKDFIFKWLDYPASNEYIIPRFEFEKSVKNAFYKKLEDLFIKALLDSIESCAHIYSNTDFSLYLCDKNTLLEFIFEVDKDGNIDGFYALASKCDKYFALELIDMCDFFTNLDECQLRMYFLLCTGKDIQGAINAYK